jgi:hypothetical protein
MVDLRTQHGVGADAIDSLNRFYELKVYSGSEPDRISLTDAEVKRALETDNFFLVIVSHVEDTGAKPTVRFIPAPLHQLRVEAGSLGLAGIKEARSLVYEFDSAEE